MRVLIAEDDARLADVLVRSLADAGWQVEVQHDGAAALHAALEAAASPTAFDVLLLDWMLPSMDGPTVCRKLRQLGIGTPVLMLTARGGTRDKVAALDKGADDYLTKPFDLDELLARLRALSRRGQYAKGGDVPLMAGGLTLDPSTHRVLRGEATIELNAREFDLLHLLMSRAGRVVTRDTVLEEVWGAQSDRLRSNVLDVYMASLRTKIDRPFGTHTITTLRGIGYRLNLDRT